MVYIFLAFFSCLFATNDLEKPRFKLYCMYTPQFQTLYEQYFLPSIKDDFEIVVRKYEQECATSIIYSPGWEKTMLHKLELLLEAIEEHWNNRIFFYSDVDIIFLRPILKASLDCLGDRDFVVQQGWPGNQLCAGFFVMRGNEKTRKLIKIAIHLLQNEVVLDDQKAIRRALKLCDPDIDWQFLPSEKFPNGSRVLKNNKQYSINSEIELDDFILLFHANNCIGLNDKYDFLNRVLNEFTQKIGSQCKN